MEKNSSPPSVLVVIAALNEEEGIGPTLAELREVLEDPMYLVVDGNSVDRTIETAKEMGASALFSLTFLVASPFNSILNLIFGGTIFISAYLTLLPAIGVLNATDLEIFRLLFHKIKSVWPIIKLLLSYEAKVLKYTQKLTQ